MKPGKANMPVILGQPWQRTYNSIPNWRREGINFEYDQARLFTPFLKDEDFATDTETEDEEEFPTPSEPAATTSHTKEAGQEKLPTETNHQKKEEAQHGDRPKTQLIKTKDKQLHNIWVPRKLVRAQQSSTQIWIPKRAIQETKLSEAWSQKPMRRQTRQLTTRMDSPKYNHTKRATKESHQGQNKTQDKRLNFKQVWVKKALLKAQGNDTYKWVPKHLLGKATFPATQPAIKKQHSTQQRWPEIQDKDRWIPKILLTKQGYYEGTSRIWVPKHKVNQATPKQLKTSHDQQPSYNQTQQRWVLKAQKSMATKEQKQENPQHSNKRTKVTKKATEQEKGKWIPKVTNMPIISYQEQLPNTSTHSTTKFTPQTTEIQSRKQPLCGKNPLEAARQLAFILRTLNSKQVEAQWRQYMTSKVTGKETSPAKALGPKLLQEPPLAQH